MPEGLKNAWKLRELAKDSRVHFMEDYTKSEDSIINKLYGNASMFKFAGTGSGPKSFSLMILYK